MTPIIKIDNFYLKREDLNLTGSAKDRAISKQIEHLIELDYKNAVISSTGNAAISAIHYCSQNNINLTVFLSPKIDKKKLSLIQSHIKDIQFSLKPISDAFKYAKKNNYYYLRQSTDPIALTGYSQIGKELIGQLPQITSLFIPVGSGATLLGLSQSLPQNVKIFAVQPASNCPLAKIFDKNFTPESDSITDALTVKSLPLKDLLINKLKTTQGSALVIQNSDILNTQKIFIKNNIITSNEGALALAGYYKALEKNMDLGDNPVILLTGQKR